MDNWLVWLNRVAWKLLGTNKQSFIALLGEAGYVDFLPLAYAQRGVMKYLENESGELFFLSDLLAPTLPSAPCIFDVGANIGTYTEQIHLLCPNASIYSFEPNPTLFTELQTRVGSYTTIVPSAVGDQVGSVTLYNDADPDRSQHGTIHSAALTELHKYKTLSRIDVPVTTLDEYVKAEGVDQIHFLKIDTEGHEFAVLRGCEALLRERRIGAIQFEFNEMNIISRVFLKDFFSLLTDFDFYRLDTKQLHPLRYTPREEIFQFQNILAVTEESGLAVTLKQRYQT